MYPYIVADIGGTNARFALITGKNNQNHRIEHIKILAASEYATLAEALKTYLESLGSIQVKNACVAVAGPVVGDRVKMTNLSWEFSCQDMARSFNFEHFIAMNDFAAVAAACSQVTADHLIEIKSGTETRDSTKAVFGPGTGLGVAGLVNNHGSWVPVPSEGGHVNIAPATAFEIEVLKAAMEQHDHVSAEVFLSGPGLFNLYRAVCAVRGETAKTLSPAEISKGALEGTEEILVQTLGTFCSFIGSFAGNLALTYGAKGGIYMAGGILPRFSDFLKASAFEERFQSKGPMSKYVKDIPAYLIVHPETPFVGSGAWLEQVMLEDQKHALDHKVF